MREVLCDFFFQREFQLFYQSREIDGGCFHLRSMESISKKATWNLWGRMHMFSLCPSLYECAILWVIWYNLKIFLFKRDVEPWKAKLSVPEHKNPSNNMPIYNPFPKRKQFGSFLNFVYTKYSLCGIWLRDINIKFDGNSSKVS